MGRGRGGAGRTARTNPTVGDTAPAPAEWVDTLDRSQFRVFSSYYEDVGWMNGEYGDQTRAMDTPTKSIMKSYADDLYKPINKHLRGEVLEPDGENYIKDGIGVMDAFFDKPTSRLKQNVMVGRRIERAFMEKVERMEPGDIFTDGAYVSTSISKGHYEVFAQSPSSMELHIYAPKGTKAAWLRPISRYKDEAELLLGRGVTFQVLSREGRTVELLITGQQ